MTATDKPRVILIGGGMITRIQILPTLYHLQNTGVIGPIDVVALNAPPIRELQEDDTLRTGFPANSFTPHPDPGQVDDAETFPDLYKQVFADAPAGSVAVVAVPDQLHYPIVMEALSNDLHVCVVKPLVLQHAQAVEIEQLARQKGLLVGVEYHKRFDYRNLMARRDWRAGRFGELRLVQAHLHEPWYYRDSNFQNWCTCENSDFFTYVGCHYVDLVAFITGLKPTAVSVYGIKDAYPNGREGYLWTDARVIWENGAAMNVMNAIAYPNAGAGGNAQGMVIWGQGPDDGTLVYHSDQYRGVKHGYTAPGQAVEDTQYGEPNPDYFRLLDLGGEALVPVGYGHRSVEFIVSACAQAAGLGDLTQRQELLARYDAEGIMATPANSSYNELVIEAGRKSILSGGRLVDIDYDTNTVHFRTWTET